MHYLQVWPPLSYHRQRGEIETEVMLLSPEFGTRHDPSERISLLLNITLIFIAYLVSFTKLKEYEKCPWATSASMLRDDLISAFRAQYQQIRSQYTRFKHGWTVKTISKMPKNVPSGGNRSTTHFQLFLTFGQNAVLQISEQPVNNCVIQWITASSTCSKTKHRGKTQ